MRTPTFEEPEGRTADPSAPLRFGRDDKGEGGASIEDFVSGCMETAGPSTAVGMTLLLGGHIRRFHEGSVELQIPPLRSG